MKNTFILSLLFLVCCFASRAQTDKPLRVFIRAGIKTHGPDQHDHPRFMREWNLLLNQRGAKSTSGMDFPTAAQLTVTDVLVMYAGDAGDISPAQRVYLNEFFKRGGGIVVIHDAIGSHDPDWLKTVIGGAWRYGRAKFFEGPISFYYLDHQHPITRGASNFDFDDEQYYEMELLPEAHVLAGTYQPDDRNQHDGRAMPSIYDIAPQMWTYEKDHYRAFVSIPGHNHKSFSLPQYRAVLLRGIAWAGKRPVDSLVSKEELAGLRYPVGGPTAPDEAAKKIQVQPDFNLKLVASEPLIEKPISMDWDPQGRLWIAETPEYPFRKDRSTPPYDRISILEDSQHDGRMDKKSVFYEGLDLVTSMVFYRNGVIVSQAPYILRLQDTNGDGKADQKEILYQGFGTNDTHAVISNLRWGMDGWIYATVGYTRGDIYSGDGQTHFGRISEGVIRFKPDGTALEQVSSKGGNTWGVDLTPDNEIFFSQANGSHVNHVVVPEAVLAGGHTGNATSYLNIEDHNRSYPLMSWKNQAYVQIDWVGNFTAAAGSCIYDGGAWPDKYDGTYYVSEPTINLVHQDYLTPKGVSYTASKDPQRLETEFIVSSDLWFRPIHQRVGPDGALYVLDFYNQAVVHNDTRGTRYDPQSNAAIRPDRDHYFGRIWRVQHNDARKFELPKLAGAEPAMLVKALEHPNEWVRMTALRLLLERGGTEATPQLQQLAASDQASSVARIHALWLLNDLHQLGKGSGEPVLIKAINSSDPALAKNGLEIIAANDAGANDAEQLRPAILAHLADTNARVRLEAIIALGRVGATPEAVDALLRSYAQLNDDWSKSAFIGVAEKNPMMFISEAFNSNNAKNDGDLVEKLARQIGAQPDTTTAAQLVIMLAGKGEATDGLKQLALASLAQKLKPQVAPAWSPELQSALHTLLASKNAQVATLALPIAAGWDKGGALSKEISQLMTTLAGKLNDALQPDEERARLVKSLLAVRQLNPDILPAVARMLSSDNSPDLQRRVIESLGELPDGGAGQVLTEAYPKLTAPLQDAALNQLLKRPDWSLMLVSAIETGKINLSALGPVAINHLRTHSDKSVSERANAIIDKLRGPEMKEKNELIAKFTPIVTQPGDVERGHQLFLQNCGICHHFNGEGKDIAPDLTGMGAHGPAELIIHVLDPNREVEPNYYAYSIETKDGEIYDGVIARENKSTVTLKNAAGVVDIDVNNIKNRRNTGLSLMPNGFETLGPEVLRDILSYLCAGAAKYRLLDLRTAFDADSAKGLWSSEESADEMLKFKKFGLIKQGDVPFEIVNPLKVANGKNLIVLKGGLGLSKTYPQKVEIPDIGFRAAKLHFLGGIGGWAFPWNGGANKGMPVAKVTVHYADQSSEEIILKNGDEFGDWIGSPDLPGSQAVTDLVQHGQVRWFTKTLQHPQIIQSLTLESYDSSVAPAFISITAEVGTGASTSAADTKQASTNREFKWQPNTRHILIVGGGSSHDFNRWFNQADSVTLAAGGTFSVNYTEQLADVLPVLKDVQVLYLNSNQPMDDEKLRQGIFDFANAGHGLLLVHPALWYNWKNWPEYNRVLVGGGAHSHDKYGEFEVSVKEPNHPVMLGVPTTFNLADELYHFEMDPQGSPMEVLAEGKNPATGKTYPVVWIVKHPKARIVCITLGHDTSAHDLAAYQTILKNAAAWVAGK